MSELLDNLRAKYPQYDDLPDAELAYRITEKYPAYKDTELLQDAMPRRAEEFGEIRATPGVARGLKEDFTGALKAVGGRREGEGVRETSLRNIQGAGTLLNLPFRAAGQAAGALAAPFLPYLPGVDEKEAARQREAIEKSVEFVPQIAGAARAVPSVAARLPHHGGKVVPRAAAARTEAPRPAFSEEAFAPSAPEFSPLPPGHPLRPVGQPPATTPFDAQAGRVDPQALFVLSRAAAGGVVGQAQGETAIDKIRYGAVGAALGAVADPRLVRAGIAASRKPLGIGPSDAALAAAKWKTKTGANLFFTPKDIARGVPIADNLVNDAFAADDISNLVRNDFTAPLDAAVKKLNYDPRDIRRVLQALDGGQIQLTPAQQAIAREIRQVYDTMALHAGQTPAVKLSDQFKALRDSTHGWGYGMYDLVGDARHVARTIANEGGTMPGTGEVVQGFAKRGAALLEEMQAQNYPKELIAYYTDYINDLVKGPTVTKHTLLTPQMASRIKNVEFMRTIGLNLGSAVSNSLQQINTFAKTSPQAFISAYYDILAKPKIVDLARKTGVTSEVLSKADIDTFANPTKLDETLRISADRVGYVFKKVEEFNRLHAFAAGLRDAASQGLKGGQAVEYARQIVNDTQFRFGIENAPKWLRGASPELSVLGQFKSYQIQQTLFLKNLLLHDPKGLIKYITGVGMIAGPDALTGHKLGDTIRASMADVFGGDPRDYKFRGLLGEAGIALGQQVGLGALPIENLQSLAFLIPGPALSHILDVASLVSNKKLSLTDVTRGVFGEELTPDQWAGLATRAVSVQLDKIRQAARVVQDGRLLRQARNLGEAMGVRPATGPAIRPTTPGEAITTPLGIRAPEKEEYGQARQEVGERVERWNELVKKKAEAIAAGDPEAVKRLNQLGLKEFGKIPKVTSQGGKGAVERQRTPALERQLRNAPKSIRQQLRKEAED